MSPLERLKDAFGRIWHCEIKDQHHVKMDSNGHCSRCGRLIEPGTQPPLTPPS